MGMYTEIYVNADLKEETPDSVVEVLKAMCEFNRDAKCLADRPERWSRLFGNGSYYTPNTQCAKLTFDSIAKNYSLLGKGDIKDYGGEIEAFFEFIKPWCDGGFIGYYRYEEDRAPTLVYSD